MVRRHGWQLPAHPFQVVAITAFFLLAVAFYVFLAPFLGSRYVEYAAIILYSFLAASVFLLYVRCSAIDPADPGVLARFVPPPSKSVLKLPAEVARRSPQHSLSSPSRTKAFGEPAQRVSYGWDVLPAGDLTSSAAQPRRSHLFLTVLPCLLCTWLVCPDNCNGRSTSQQPVADEDILFCTLCNAEVRKHSKHCRSCDKCVDGFDHHCRWLNNCVGKRNYATFVALMSTSLVLLNLQWGIGTAVLVRCFVDRRGIEHQIVEKLGNSFSRPPFAALVAICAAVSFVASIPLGELLFFHMILIRKGISTYEYVIAMRAQADAQGDSVEGDVPSIPSTPASSTATGLSGSSSLGLHNRGAWCTPPKIFVEHQDEVVPHLGSGRIPSTVDPDALSNVVGRELRLQKRPVRISAWKLAKLNADEAARAAVKARENSSVLRYVASRDAGKGQLEYSSSGNLSRVSSASHDHRVTVKDANEETSCHSSQSVWASSHMSRGDWNSAFEHPRSVVNSPLSGANDLTMSPLRTTGRSVPSSSLVLSAPNLSSQQEAVPLSLMVLASSTKQKQPTPDTPGSSMFGAESSSWVDLTAASDGYEASSGESADDLAPQQHHDLAKATQVETKGGWNTTGDSSVDATKIASRAGTSVSSGRVFGTSIFSRSRLAWPDPSASPSVSDEPVSSDFASENFSSSQASPSRQGARPTSPGPTDSDTLRFNGTCIFYGGPLTLDAKMPVLKESAQSLPPRLPLRQQDFRIKFPREANKESRPRIPLRSQSPVFQPHAMPVASSGLGPSGNSQF